MEQKPIKLEYWGVLPSVNHMYGRRPNGALYLKEDGKALKQAVMLTNKERFPKDVEVGYNLKVFGIWHNPGAGKRYKDPKTKEYRIVERIKRRDSNNLVKLIVDACSEAIGIDDKQIFHEKVMKVESETEGFEIEFYILPKFQ